MFKLGFNANDPEQHLFTNPTTNESLSKMTINHKLWSICDSNNFKWITLHGFRHTCCSLLFEAGIGVKEVQAILGHSSIKTTLDIYTHVTKDVMENASEQLANYANF